MTPFIIGAVLFVQAATSSTSGLIAAPTIEQAYSTTSLMQFASSIADEYHLNKAHFLTTLKCESGFVYDAKGDDGNSLGIAQISMKWHPEISYTQATDPEFALRWMANEWLHDHASRWTCWRKYYGHK